MAFHQRADLVFIKLRQLCWSVKALTSDGSCYMHACPVTRHVHMQGIVNATRDKAFLQD